MRSLVLGAAITMATAVGVKAADLAYPPQYGAVDPRRLWLRKSSSFRDPRRFLSITVHRFRPR